MILPISPWICRLGEIGERKKKKLADTTSSRYPLCCVERHPGEGEPDIYGFHTIRRNHNEANEMCGVLH